MNIGHVNVSQYAWVTPLTKYLSGGTSGVKRNTTCQCQGGPVEVGLPPRSTWTTRLARVITQRVVVIPNRRFGTIYLSHFQLTLQDGTDRLPGNVGKELQLPAK